MTYKEASSSWPKLGHFPVPAKVLVTAVLFSMAIGFIGALGQILIHDILPTFYKLYPPGHVARSTNEAAVGGRGDLFADTPSQPRPKSSKPFYESAQFVWTLRWTHIHLFGMNIIFIFVGMVTACLT
jgi:hypothetical protein